MKLNIFKEIEVRVPRRRLQRLFDILTAEETHRFGKEEVNLVLTSDRRLRSLNRQFRGLDRATDVLSFDVRDADPGDGTFGEIYVSVPTAARQAVRHGTSLSQEILRLTCHGLLHLFGYDHRKESAARVMQEREDYYLSRR